ncbi:MAG: DUF1853 family protein [Betaproteobacteria bacterium]|nr:MAG: DUF1853 family protein [Betaproteobacteria bacterium]
MFHRCCDVQNSIRNQRKSLLNLRKSASKTKACHLLNDLLKELTQSDVRRLAWAIGSPSLFDSNDPVWKSRLRTDAWSASELARCSPWLHALDRNPQSLSDAIGDPLINAPLGHTFEKFVLLWQSQRPDVRHATRGLVVKSGNRTVGEFDVVMLRHDGIIETLEVTVKYYLNLNPTLGIDGCIGPRAFDRMSDKFKKMTERQTSLGDTEAGRITLAKWLTEQCGEPKGPEQITVENFALARGYLFHPSADALIPKELSPNHGRGLWQTDAIALPGPHWRNLAGREWLGPYRGEFAESGWPNDPAMPRMYACIHERNGQWDESERRFVVRADSGLLKSV